MVERQDGKKGKRPAKGNYEEKNLKKENKNREIKLETGDSRVHQNFKLGGGGGEKHQHLQQWHSRWGQ